MTKISNLFKNASDSRTSLQSLNCFDKLDHKKLDILLKELKSKKYAEKPYIVQKNIMSLEKKAFINKGLDYYRKDRVAENPDRYPISSIRLKKLPVIKLKKVQLSKVVYNDNDFEIENQISIHSKKKRNKTLNITRSERNVTNENFNIKISTNYSPRIKRLKGSNSNSSKMNDKKNQNKQTCSYFPSINNSNFSVQNPDLRQEKLNNEYV